MPPPQPQRPLSDRGDVDKVGNLQDRSTWLTGILLSCHYANFHHDPMPVIICLYVDRRYTHAVNVSYLNGGQRRQFKAQLKYWYSLDPRLKYAYLKTYNPTCLVGYRTYFTMMLRPVSAWTIPELEGMIPQSYSLSLRGKINGPPPTDFKKFGARAIQAAKIQQQVMGQRVSQRPNQQRPDSRVASGRIRPLLERVRSAVGRLNSAAVRPSNIRPNKG